MARSAPSGVPGFPCSPEQAVALYQLLFRRPAGPGQLQAALGQMSERQGCPPGLELPLVMLEMERTRWAQEKLLWDLELLTGAGLGLFWPPSARFCGQKNQAQYAWSQHSQSGGRIGGNSEQLNSRLHLLTQTGGTPSQSHRLPEGGQDADSSSASDLGEARSDADQRPEGPSILTEATSGCFQEPNPATRSSFKEPENSELKDLSQREERRQTEPIMQNSHGQTAGSPQGRKLIQRVPEPSEGLSRSSLARQGASEGLSSDLGPEGAGDAPTLLDTARLQGQSGQPSWGDRQGEDKVTPDSQPGNSLSCRRKRAARAQGVEARESGESAVSGAWGEARRVGGKSPENQIPQRGETGSSEPLKWTTQLTTQEPEARAQLGAVVEGVFLPTPRTPTPPGLPGPPGGPPASQARGLPAASQEGSPSRMEPDGGPGHPEAPGAAWPAPGRLSAAQQGAALQRLLELRGAARQRLRREREQQRLRVLERLHILGNRHHRVHPLGLPPSTAQLESQGRGSPTSGPSAATIQEDEAGRRRALWEQLDQVHQERTPRLRTLRARNTQNFWELLSPKPENLESNPYRQHPHHPRRNDYGDEF